MSSVCILKFRWHKYECCFVPPLRTMTEYGNCFLVWRVLEHTSNWKIGDFHLRSRSHKRRGAESSLLCIVLVPKHLPPRWMIAFSWAVRLIFSLLALIVSYFRFLHHLTRVAAFQVFRDAFAHIIPVYFVGYSYKVISDSVPWCAALIVFLVHDSGNEG